LSSLEKDRLAQTLEDELCQRVDVRTGGALWNLWRIFLPENRDIFEELLKRFGSSMQELCQRELLECRIVGIETGGAVIAGVLSFKMGAPISVLRMGHSAVNPIPGKKKVLLVDDVSVTGTTAFIGRELLRQRYAKKVEKIFAIASLKPALGINVSEEEWSECLRRFHFVKHNFLAINFIANGVLCAQETSKGGSAYLGCPLPNRSILQNVKDIDERDVEVLLRSTCRNDVITSWSIYNDAHTVDFLSDWLSLQCVEAECNCIFSLSVWSHPLAAVVSYKTGLPLVTFKEWGEPKLRPDLVLFPNIKRFFLVDTLLCYGQKINRIAENYLQYEKEATFVVQPVLGVPGLMSVSPIVEKMSKENRMVFRSPLHEINSTI